MKRKKNTKNLILSKIITLILVIGTSGLTLFSLLNSNLTDKITLLSVLSIFPDGAKTILNNNESKEKILQTQAQNNIDNSNNITSNIEKNNIVEHDTEQENNIIENIVSITPDSGKGIVLSETFATFAKNSLNYKNAYIKNSTSLSADQVLAYASEEPEFNILKNGMPQVLIYHTHTTESYLLEDTDQYDLSYTGRTTDLDKNMVRVGEEITKELEAVGISVIHDTTIHDHQYMGSYERSKQTIQKYLDEYPSIEIALDIHRDAIIRNDNTIVKPTTTINDRNAAQVMIIAGCDNGTMNMPNWPHNLRFAVRLQDKIETMFPGLMRPILFDYRSYNQNMTNGSLLIEVGGHANTLEEATYSGELIGKALASYLDEISN